MTRPGWGERIAALLCYAGFLPDPLLWRRRNLADYAAIHRNQSLALFAFLGGVAVVLIALIFLLSYGMVYHRDFVERLPTEVWLLSFGRKLLIVWAVFWGYALISAMRGSSVPVPYMVFFARQKFLQHAGRGVLCVLWLVLLIVASLIFMAETAVTSDVSRGRVFMVYEDLNRFPRPLFSLAMYPMARAAVKRYGAESAVLLPASHEAIQAAVTQGVVVVIASHGTANGLLLQGGYFTPADVPPLGEDASLRFVYLAGCDSGVQRLAWEAALYPATVKTYNRLTPVIEHLWWFWTQGPKVIREVNCEL